MFRLNAEQMQAPLFWLNPGRRCGKTHSSVFFRDVCLSRHRKQMEGWSYFPQRPFKHQTAHLSVSAAAGSILFTAWGQAWLRDGDAMGIAGVYSVTDSAALVGACGWEPTLLSLFTVANVTLGTRRSRHGAGVRSPLQLFQKNLQSVVVVEGQTGQSQGRITCLISP